MYIIKHLTFKKKKVQLIMFKFKLHFIQKTASNIVKVKTLW